MSARYGYGTIEMRASDITRVEIAVAGKLLRVSYHTNDLKYDRGEWEVLEGAIPLKVQHIVAQESPSVLVPPKAIIAVLQHKAPS